MILTKYNLFFLQALIIHVFINISWSRFVDHSIFTRNENVDIKYIPKGKFKHNDILFSSNFTIIKYMSDDEKNNLKEELEDMVGISAETDSENFSFYDQLNDDEKEFYDILRLKSSQNPPEYEIDVKITGITTDLQTYYYDMYNRLEKVFTVLAYENPDLWWIGDIALCAYQGDENNSLVFTFFIISEESNFYSIINQIPSINKEISEEGNKIINYIKQIGLTTEYSILRYIHDYLITKNVYKLDNSLMHIRTLYGGLVEGMCVCEGYAEAFQYLANFFNINCIIARSSSHEWNFVELNGKWYVLDVTYDDPTIPGMDISSGKNGNLQLDYFLTGTEHVSQLNYPKYTEDSAHTLVYTAYGTGNKVISYPTLEKEDYVPTEKEKNELDLIDFTFPEINSPGETTNNNSSTTTTTKKTTTSKTTTKKTTTTTTTTTTTKTTTTAKITTASSTTETNSKADKTKASNSSETISSINDPQFNDNLDKSNGISIKKNGLIVISNFLIILSSILLLL